MNKFVVSRILANGDLVVRPGWVWGGCKGQRVRAFNKPGHQLKHGAAIELRDGIAVEDGCLVCELRIAVGEKTETFPISAGPLSTGLTLSVAP